MTSNFYIGVTGNFILQNIHTYKSKLLVIGYVSPKKNTSHSISLPKPENLKKTWDAYKELRKLNFTARVIAARQNEKVINMFNNNTQLLYDFLIYQLLKNALCKSYHNKIFYAMCCNNENLLITALNNLTTGSEENQIASLSLSQEPWLIAAHFVTYAVYHAFINKEMLYFNAIEDKIHLLTDIFDHKPAGKNIYHRQNIFHINKISPL